MPVSIKQIIDALKKIKPPRGKPSKTTRDDYLLQVRKATRKTLKPKGKEK